MQKVFLVSRPSDALNLLLSIVHGTPGSCLVMIGQTLWAQASLRDQARAFATTHSAFDPEVRLLFRFWPECTDDRIRLMSHGGLLLANCEGGSVTAAGMQALAACLPVLVCEAVFGVTRDISSALNFLGLGEELVAKGEDRFVEKGQELGNHRGKILRMKLYLQGHAADKTSLFSEERQIKEWENGLEKVYQLKEGDSKDDDIDATLPEFMPCPALQLSSPDLQPTAVGMKRSIASVAPKDPELEAAQQRESTVLRMASANPEFNNPVAKAQLDSLLEDVQEHGVNLGRYAGGGGFSSVVLGTVIGSKARGVSPGQAVALLFEKRKAPAERVYNRALFRYCAIISAARRRRPHDAVMVQPVRLFDNGTSSFSISYPDEEGKSIFCLVVAGLDLGYLEALENDIKDWTESARLSERLRCDLQKTLFALNRIHEAMIVHGDIKPDNIMRTSDGEIVFVDWGGGWMFGGRNALIERRATSVATDASIQLAGAKKRRNKLAALAKLDPAAMTQKSVRSAAPSAKESAVKKHLPRSSSRLPEGRKPRHLSEVAIRSIMQSVVEKDNDLATLGNGSAMFRNAELWRESGRALTLAIGNDSALRGTPLLCFRPF